MSATTLAYAPATYILIGINILVFLAETAGGGSTDRNVALKFGAQYTPYIRQGQWYRLFTSMFLHFGFLHLICNMYSLSNLGPALERFFGIPIFVALYLASGLAGNLLTWAMEQKSGRYTMSLGASGADLGPLPAGSRALLIGLACVWVLLGAYAIAGRVKKRKG